MRKLLISLVALLLPALAPAQTTLGHLDGNGNITFTAPAGSMSGHLYGNGDFFIQGFPAFNVTSPSNGQCLVYQASSMQWLNAACGGGGGSGTVTTVSVVHANGMNGSVATATTTPAITLIPDIAQQTIADSTANLSYCEGFNACAGAVFSSALKGFVTAFGDSVCGGAGGNLSNSGANIELTCMGWRVFSMAGAGSSFSSGFGVGSGRYAALVNNVTLLGVDNATTNTTTVGTSLSGVTIAGVGNARLEQVFSTANIFGNNNIGGAVNGLSSPTHVNILGSNDFASTAITSPTGLTAVGDNLGATCATGNHVMLMGTNSEDCPLSSTANYLSIEDVLKVTGTNTPSSSVTTVAGTLQQLGGTAVPLPTDTQVFTSGGTWTRPTTGTIKAVRIICIGGGGGGGGGITTASGTASSGGGGGGGGSYYEATVTGTIAGASQTITVGASGTAGAAAGQGGNGGTGSFGSLLQCPGGGGGGPGGSAANSAGGGGAGTRTAGTQGSGVTGGTGGSSNGMTGAVGAAGTNNGSPGGGASGSGGTNGAAGNTGGIGSALWAGGNSGASGGGVTAGPATTAGGDGLQSNTSTHITGGTAGSGGNGGTGAAGSTGVILDWSPGAAGAGGGSAVAAFVGGAGGAGGRGSGGGGGGSALSTGTAGAGGLGGPGIVVVITLF